MRTVYSYVIIAYHLIDLMRLWSGHLHQIDCWPPQLVVYGLEDRIQLLGLTIFLFEIVHLAMQEIPFVCPH